jgi:hypothetical protein
LSKRAGWKIINRKRKNVASSLTSMGLLKWYDATLYRYPKRFLNDVSFIGRCMILPYTGWSKFFVHPCKKDATRGCKLKSPIHKKYYMCDVSHVFGTPSPNSHGTGVHYFTVPPILKHILFPTYAQSLSAQSVFFWNTSLWMYLSSNHQNDARLIHGCMRKCMSWCE